jgi:hypothetical protein
MPRKRPKQVLAAQRVAEARRIVVEQQALIERLKAEGRPTLEAERSLQSYESALKHLEAHERSLRESRKPKSE